ncbi:MAG: hypothetical protein K0Q55_402 [Verrucomicrobia bacterium]|jgi:hypothetical protein|nr:hypothetical protein [Verrucomicrobiota bacterium]
MKHINRMTFSLFTKRASSRLLVGALGAWLCAGCASPPPHGVPIPVQASATASVTKPTGKPTPKNFKVGEHGTLAFDLPGGWSYKTYRTNPLIPAAFRLDAPDKSAAMLVSVSWDGIGTSQEAPDEQLLERKLRNQAEKRIRNSVEKSVVLKTVLLTDGYAQYAQFTEAMWTNAEVPKGNYRYVTDGAFRCGNLWGSFTVYSQDKTGESFRPALAIVQSLHKLDR